jgi:hypothetical protein
MPTPASHDFEARQGSYFAKAFDLGTLPVDLEDSGTIIRLQIREYAGAEEVALEATNGDDARITVTGAATFTIYISAVDMASIGPAGEGLVGSYDLEIVPQGTESGAFALLAGTFTISGEVTR